MPYSRIIGTGSYLPSKILYNSDLEKIVDTSDEWIRERTGICERRIAAEGETVSSMAEHAAREALSAAGIAATELDLIIVATSTPERSFPSVACLLQDRLGLRSIPAFDISAACAGFIYALSIADQYIRTGGAKRVLVVGSEIMSGLVDWKDRATCILFGDGAGAVVLGADSKPGIISTHLHADGCYQKQLYVSNKFDAQPHGVINMIGKEVYKLAVVKLSEIVDEALLANNLEHDAIDWLVPHQANIRILQGTAKRLSLGMEQVIVTLDKHGNTSAASVPLALDKGIRDNRIKRGDLCLLEGIGGGMVWGAALVRY